MSLINCMNNMVDRITVYHDDKLSFKIMIYYIIVIAFKKSTTLR